MGVDTHEWFRPKSTALVDFFNLRLNVSRANLRERPSKSCIIFNQRLVEIEDIHRGLLPIPELAASGLPIEDGRPWQLIALQRLAAVLVPLDVIEDGHK